MDIGYSQSNRLPQYSVDLDWLVSPINLIDDGPALTSAFIVALGTDALAGESDPLPDLDSTDRKGWWGDLDAEEIWNGWPVGNKLWLLKRAKITSPMAADGGTVYRAESYVRECLKPFIDQKIVSSIDVSVERTDVNRIDISIVAYRGRNVEVALRYSELWDELRNP